MISFPNIKINIGLDIVSRRDDGYHNIETVFYPVLYHDILEIVPSDEFELINKGILIDCQVEKNLCYKAFKLLADDFNIPPVKIILFKNVPFGTGLGSGSADAAHTLILLNKINNLQLNENQLISYASRLGADCAFFVKNKPVLASGVGNEFKDVELNLHGKYLMLCLPDVSVNTADAYKNCKPAQPKTKLEESVKLPIEKWKDSIKNDFEKTVFQKFPILSEIKNELYQNGALYAQMSGSGSSVFGIFDSNPDFSPKTVSRFKMFLL